MKRLKETAQRLWKEESAQGATEYILLLVIVVAIAMMFKNQIVSVIQSKIGQVGGDLQNFNP